MENAKRWEKNLIDFSFPFTLIKLNGISEELVEEGNLFRCMLPICDKILLKLSVSKNFNLLHCEYGGGVFLSLNYGG
jgi:hypothetical protein